MSKGLYGIPGEHLPRYVKKVRDGILRENPTYSESRATATAIAALHRWAIGGGDVDPDKRAKAVAALAELAKSQAKARSIPNKRK